ncbi:MAG: site-specific tyrosine recombinase/integron integrase [Bacteroidota bacterium]|nr:site-specific tyrosine recombinase/integron integrase [Bacteroidota bacterium]
MIDQERSETRRESVSMTITERFFLLKMKKDNQDIRFLRTLRYARWDSTGFCWVINNKKENLTMLRNYFGDRLTENSSEENSAKIAASAPGLAVKSSTLIVVKYRNGRIRLIFRYEKELVRLIKSLPLYAWDQENRWWTIAHTENSLAALVSFCEESGWKYQYLEDLRHLNKKPRQKPEDVINYRSVPATYLDKLSVLRYSLNTVKIYKACFSEFINYYSTKEIIEITQQDIQAYLLYLVQERQVSTSYQNQAINAIKFYFEKVLSGPRRVYYIERPRKEKLLPSVLSEDEVKRIFEKVKNLKHKCLLMICYSGGLRISEVLNLKPIDIDSNRMLINIKGGKGKKDRVSLLSVKLLELLRDYYRIYKPNDYLFAGQMGGRYSERSAQLVLKKAANKAGIKRRVTLHTLRHSFATHLLENGTDIRYIQSLLGHSSPKTTQIYTHITTRGIDQIKNPLDNLGIL